MSGIDTIGRDRYPLLVVQILVLGFAMAGLQANTARYAFGSIPLPYTIVLAPVVGFLISRWTRNISEVLLVLSGTAAVGFVSTVAVLASPVYLADVSTLEANVLVMDAVPTSIVYTGLSTVTAVAGLILGTIGDRENLLRGTRFDSGRVLSVIAAAMLVLGLVLAATVAVNYASTVDQRDVVAHADDLSGDEDGVAVTIELENRLAGTLAIDSAVIGFSSAGERETWSTFPDERVDSGDTGTITVEVTCAELDEEGITGAELEIDGDVHVSAFNDYDTRASIDSTTFENPCR